ncbi:hypothetical protein MHU86_18978 [Fragilaria crotonensis]|jgi:hypothetical protein|nr:hypothetical protein MHU86_18978 [Fragilaria crotonensis]
MPDPDTALDGIGSLIRMTGFTVPSRARFVGETMVTASLASLTVGIVCGNIGSMIPSVGPLVPFLFGSWFGYSVGLVSHWRTSQDLAKKYARMYPSLMLYALNHQAWDLGSEPVAQHDEPLEEWITKGGLARTTVSILAAQSLKSCVRDIEKRGRDKAAEEYFND